MKWIWFEESYQKNENTAHNWLHKYFKDVCLLIEVRKTLNIGCLCFLHFYHSVIILPLYI